MIAADEDDIYTDDCDPDQCEGYDEDNAEDDQEIYHPNYNGEVDVSNMDLAAGA